MSKKLGNLGHKSFVAKNLERRRIVDRMGLDWTVNPLTGRSNSSPEFEKLVSVVSELIQDSAFDLIHGRTKRVARLILAQLAHKYHLAPQKN